MSTEYRDRIDRPEWRELMNRREAEGEQKGETGRTKKQEMSITPRSIEPIADVIKYPAPENADHGLVSVPLVRHWIFAPDGTKLRYRDLCIHTIHKGREIVQRIRVGDRFAAPGTGYGVLKAQHQRLLFAIQDLWQEQGGKIARVDGNRSAIVCASSRDLESRFFRSHGGRQQRTVRALIQQLASIPVKITNFINQNNEISYLDVTGLILGSTFLKTSQGGRRNTPWVEIYLSSVITDAFEQNAIKPVNLRVLSEFRSDMSALLYPKFDYYLASHPETEMRLYGLVEKMGLSGNQLNQRRYRLRKFEPSVDELHGKPLSTEGYVIDAKIVPTSDGRDNKIIGRRRRA